MIHGLVQRLKWSLLLRRRIARSVTGFSASPFSYCDGDCRFAEYVALGRGVRLTDVAVGRFSYLARVTALRTRIGAFCSIGQDVKIGGFAKHPLHVSTHPVFYRAQNPSGVCLHCLENFEDYRPVDVEHDVWIGDRAILMDGITVHTGAVVAAGAVVTKDVPPYEIVGGVPARSIRQRFSAETIETLLRTKWWEWDLARLKRLAPFIASPEPTAFLRAAAESTAP